MAPLIRLNALCREFPSGDGSIAVLSDVDLEIEAGEFVAIMGASGSGKSTLMNILGCLDRPTAGDYWFGGRSVAALDADEQAELRREHFGFIFQRYHLLAELDARSNVEVPAVYAGVSRQRRRDLAERLLVRLGMAGRTHHRPNQLSGGQQQRVSIARALINWGEVILADEPTGALDRYSGDEVLKILEELNAEGRTVILVTHDAAVATRARRVIEISDGRIVVDRTNRQSSPPAEARNHGWQPKATRRTSLDGVLESLRMAVLAMTSHRLRTVLTMLGIVIGIASVVAMVALGEGSRRKVLSNISTFGTNTLEFFPGKGFGDTRAAKIKTLVLADTEALSREDYVEGATPTVSASSTLRYRSVEANVQVNGVGADYFVVKGTRLENGRFFDTSAEQTLSQEAVIDENAQKTLFGEAGSDPTGKVILVGKVPCVVIGVTQKQQGFGSSGNISLFLPYSTVQARFLGDTSLRSIILRVADNVDNDLAEQAATAVLERRHEARDFFVFNTSDIRNAITLSTQVMTALIAAIAIISLIVGGIGVMSIMLVSVSERVQEIGVRIAVGARRSDIMQQFLIEAILVCLIGGGVGVLCALAVGFAFHVLGSSFAFVYSPASFAFAFACSTLIGVVFGWLPARGAARLDPIDALARE